MPRARRGGKSYFSGRASSMEDRLIEGIDRGSKNGSEKSGDKKKLTPGEKARRARMKSSEREAKRIAGLRKENNTEAKKERAHQIIEDKKERDRKEAQRKKEEAERQKWIRQEAEKKRANDIAKVKDHITGGGAVRFRDGYSADSDTTISGEEPDHTPIASGTSVQEGMKRGLLENPDWMYHGDERAKQPAEKSWKGPQWARHKQRHRGLRRLFNFFRREETPPQDDDQREAA